MAAGATIYTIDIDLADSDRGVYETLALRVARHPSESEEFLIARVLAYALEFTDGIAFSAGGLSDADEAPIAVRDLTGALRSWIDVGMPDAARLHRASKLAPRVSVYTHRDPERLKENLAGHRIHRAEAVEIHALDRTLIAALAARLERRMAFALAVHDRELFVAIGSDNLSGAITRVAL
jgi:uncharacterized protein YaeQ